MEWLAAEQIGPQWDALRHAELLTALHNGPMRRHDGRNFTAADFLRPSPWKTAPEQDPAEKFLNALDAHQWGG